MHFQILLYLHSHFANYLLLLMYLFFQYLAIEGAHLAALDPSSYTAIHLASMNGHNSCLEVINLIVQANCMEDFDLNKLTSKFSALLLYT